jgi:hypothetical protein
MTPCRHTIYNNQRRNVPQKMNASAVRVVSDWSILTPFERAIIPDDVDRIRKENQSYALIQEAAAK